MLHIPRGIQPAKTSSDNDDATCIVHEEPSVDFRITLESPVDIVDMPRLSCIGLFCSVFFLTDAIQPHHRVVHQPGLFGRQRSEPVAA
jgi:hypothetical protein